MIALAIIVVGAPTADLICFGFHDHVADADHHGDQHVDGVSGLHHVSHHCDFGMNPGDVATVAILPTPLPAPHVRRTAPARRIVSRPFVPFTPPRT